MNVLAEFMWDLHKEGKKANKERYVGGPKEIRINHEWFYLLAADIEIMGRIELHQAGSLTFMGIPMNRTTDVEKWEIVF